MKNFGLSTVDAKRGVQLGTPSRAMVRFAKSLLLILSFSGLLQGATNAFAAVTYQGAGNAVAGTTVTGLSSSPAWPVHAVNDIALLFVESAGGEPVTLGVPNGFVPVSNSPQATGAGTAGTRITVFWARATSAAMPAPRIATPSDHFYARIVTFRGVVNTGDPVDVTSGGVKAAASTSVTLTGVTTTVSNTLIVQAVARDNDSAAAAFSAQTNANLTGITERLDAGTTNGNGGGLGVWAGVKATAGATGNTTATVTSSINAFITIALKPQPRARYQAAGAAVGGPASVNPAWPVHAVDDIALLFVESAGGEAATLSTPAGFVAVANSPQASGAGTAGTRITVFWARATSTTMATPRVADAGDHVYARILTYRNVSNVGNPWDVTGGGVKTPASTSVTVSGVTTTVANTLIVQAVARDNDSAAAAFGAQTNANLSGIVERTDAGTTQQNGGGFAVWDGAMITAGATGNTTASVTSSINAFLTIALAPGTAATALAPVYQGLGAAVTTGLNWPAHAIDDIALLFVESPGGQAVTLADAEGFLPVLNSPQATGAGAAGTQLTVFWARATSAAMAGPTLTGPADHAYARIITYRGVSNTGDPWNVTGGGVKAGASTSVTVTGITTTVANTRIVQAVARDNDNAAAAFSAETNANLAAIAERSDAGTTTGNGGGFVVWDGAKATAGATGNTTANVTSSSNAFLSIALRPPAAGPDHYELSLPTTSVACLANPVVVTACADTTSPCTNLYAAASGETATLTAGAGSLAATTVTFGATGVANTTLSYPAALDGATSTIVLSGESLDAVNQRKCCPDGVSCVAANSCSITFNTAGFIFSAATDDVVATIPAQVSGITSPTYYLRAVKTNTTSKACESALTGASSVNFAYECNNPATCFGADLMSVNGGTATTVARNNDGSVASYSTVSMTFDANGNAPFTFNYSDVGQVKLYASKAPAGTLLTTLAGSSNAFVVAPHHFGFSAITAGPIKAGNNFSATVTAYNGLATSAATPSFGMESTPEGVTLSSTLVTPDPLAFTSASNPTPGNNVIPGTEFGATGMVNDAAGMATVNNLSWDEAGSITLTANLTGGNYLGSGLSASGTSTTIGAFIPDHFDTVISGGMACPIGLICPIVFNGFVYSGQPFSIQVNALNLTGGVTQNYHGPYGISRAVTLTAWNALAGLTSNPGPGILTNSAIPAADFLNGVAVINAANVAPATLAPVYTFTNPTTTPTAIYIRAVDTDNVTSLRGLASVEAGIEVVNGRIKVSNAYGSELLTLPMSAMVQYWNGTGWTASTTDNATSFDTRLNAAGGNVVPVIIKGPLALDNISVVGGGTVTVIKGSTVFTLDKSNATGFADISINAPSYLPGINGRATFGVYKASNPFIYQRESY